MQLPIPQIRPQRRRKNLHLLNRPPQRPRKQRKTHALRAPVEVLANPLAQLLVLLVFRPSIDRPLVRHRYDIYEASLAHHLRHVGYAVERETGFGGAVVHVVVPADEGGVCGERAVVAFDDEVDVVDFEVAVSL